MGKTHEAITAKHAEFIARCPVFFVATAPASTAQRVNVSPRSPGTACVVTGPQSVAFADLSGSGCETAAHVLENGRMCLLFVNLLEGPPMMLRLHGLARIELPEEVEPELLAKFPQSITRSKGFRCVFRLEVQRISTSCGYSMPVMTLDRYRTTLEEHSASTDMDAYREKKNCFSIDGLPSLMLLKDDLGPKVAPKPTDGYIFSAKLGPLDWLGKSRARARVHLVRSSPARGGSLSLPTPSTPLLPALYYFSLGVAACLVFQSAQALLRDAA
mmetsp:Transcript_2642/g.8260  ORF Transcript_2642/g.8260 Transcript_2642/m.8260 type:complete len:272 (+) Transcript_2642:34-849(+)